MELSPRNALLGSLLLLGCVATCSARAEAPSSEAVTETRRERAKLEFKHGSDLYDAGQYEKSVSAFMAADRLASSAALSFNIARAYEHMGDTSGTLRWYRDYLRRSPRASNAAEVQARINQLSRKLSEAGLQQLTVVSTPGGARVMLDGRAVGMTPFTGDFSLGKHRLQLDLTGYRDQGRDISLAPSAPQDQNIAMDAEPAPAHTAQVATNAVPSPLNRDLGRRFGIAPWLIAGSGAVGLGGALGFELKRRADEDAARAAPNQLRFKTESDAMQRHQTTARVLGGVGGALFVTGTVMMLFNDQTPVAPRVGFGCTLKGCTASAHGSF